MTQLWSPPLEPLLVLAMLVGLQWFAPGLGAGGDPLRAFATGLLAPLIALSLPLPKDTRR